MVELTPEENLKVFHALNHPVRLEILAFIYDEGERQKVAEAMNSLFKEKPDIYQGVEETTNV